MNPTNNITTMSQQYKSHKTDIYRSLYYNSICYLLYDRVF
jgi:hypothetical protein